MRMAISGRVLKNGSGLQEPIKYGIILMGSWEVAELAAGYHNILFPVWMDA